MPQSGSPRDSHLPKCSRAILHALWPGAHHASPKLRGQRSVRAVGHHARPRVRYFPPQGRPSRGPARSAGVCRCSKWVSATPEAPSTRHSVPHAGSAPQQGSRQPGPPPSPGAPVVSPYLRGWGRRARTHPRSPSHRPPRSREHKAFHEQPCSNPQAGGGPRSAGSPSNGARSHAQPRIRSLAQSGSRH
ncbi:hypothetical protein NDU88_011040 [Pleurodeles waltl]|uniref:Uncharacterized protein n=1 Tax=Pleurodeles waltl TaxID=8319 RepID=A0AAV7QXH0_PLEWA|nr:hypothetical protein NDU88_011040 [Pleurodeles waltl]